MSVLLLSQNGKNMLKIGALLLGTQGGREEVSQQK